MTTAQVSNLPRRSRRAEAYDAIRLMVARCELAPGSSFTEGELAAKLGMSTVPVREALLLLAGHHLVAARHGAGYSVAPITAESAEDAYRTRVLLECDAARHAARHDGERTAQHLRALKARSAHELECRFHKHLGQHSGSVRLLHALELALLECERIERYVGVSPAVKDHEELTRAIAQGRGADTRRLLIRHLSERRDMVLARLP